MSADLIDNWDKFLVHSKHTFEEKLRVETDTGMAINDFRFLQTVGTGTFGTVVLARSVIGDDYYAIKILEKTRIIKLNQVNQTLNEKRLLLATDFPFIVHMLHFFKDNSYIYFVMQFINGGEMFNYLRKAGKFDESISSFYASQVVLALEYLHYLDIVYRDLKPENVLIDNTGYIKITDLGFAKVVTTRTYTLCGTPDYLAPEVILSRGYSHSVDWWALGVFIYEMVAGHPPFYASDPMKTYELIVSGRFKMIPAFTEDLKDLIRKLLKVDTTKRIGALKSGVSDIKNHSWFRRIMWLEVVNKKVKAPFIPQVSGPGDTSHFEEYEFKQFKVSSFELFKEEFKDF